MSDSAWFANKEPSRLRLRDNRTMRGKRLKVLMTIAAIALIGFSTWLVQHVRERHKAAEREASYQTVLAKYMSELKPGTTREQVERHLQANGIRFRQMCCVANFRDQYVSLKGAGYDDLVKIGKESAPWFCSENNVYIAFEFNPKSQGELSDTNAPDVLKRVSVFHQLEGCL
jgi:hypothetical protein